MGVPAKMHRFRQLAMTVGVLTLAPLALSQHHEDANLAGGFQTNHVFEGFGSENVNVLNGNLAWSFPLTGVYPGEGRLNTQIILSYNAKLWATEMKSNTGCPPSTGSTAVPVIERNGPVGLGFSIHWGRILYHDQKDQCAPPGSDDPIDVVYYEDPSGNLHRLYYDNTLGYFQTTDSTFIRAIYDQDHTTHNPEGGTPGTWTLWTPDGIKYTFDHYVSTGSLGLAPCDMTLDCNGGDEEYYHDPRKGWYPTQITDPFTSTTATTISYHGTIRWAPEQITDSLGRGFTFTINTAMSRIEGLAFPNFTGGTSNITFGYFQDDVEATINAPPGATYSSVNFLKEVVFPGTLPGEKLEFTYRYAGSGNVESGELDTVKLPTGAIYDYAFENYFYSHGWAYQKKAFPPAPTGKPTFETEQRGVVAKTLTEGSNSYNWSYGRIVPSQASNPSQVDVYQPDRGAGGAATDLVRYCFYHTDLNNSSDCGNYNDGLVQEIEYFQGASTLLRSETFEYEQPANPGSLPTSCGPNNPDGTNPCATGANMSLKKKKVTTFDSSQSTGQCVVTTNTGWDGKRYITKQIATGTGACSFPAPLRTTTTTWLHIDNPGGGHWQVGLPDYVTVTEDGTSVSTDFEYDTSTGFLTKETRNHGGSPTLEMEYSSHANDDGKVGQIDYKFDGAMNPSHRIKLDYQHGAQSQKTWVDVTDPMNTLPISNRSINQDTGLVSAECLPSVGAPAPQVAGCTTYSYDELQRLTLVGPHAEEALNITYSDLRNTSLTKGTVGVADYDYDTLGRLILAERHTDIHQSPAATAKQDYLYNAYGQVIRQSEWRASFPPTNNCTQAPLDNTCSIFDALGRVVSTTTPDGTTTTSYGSFPTVRVSHSFESPLGIETSMTDLTYDGLGRLTKVVPCAGAATNCNSESVEYDYDQFDNVLMADLPSHDYTFTYNGLSFLTSEFHPETGTTNYTGFDALGNPSTVTLNDATVLTYAYDFTGRLTTITSGVNQYVENFYDDDAVCGAGKLEGNRCRSIRHNYGSGSDEKVTIDYRFDPTTGKLTDRDTTVERTSFTLSFSDVTVGYSTTHGKPIGLTYPRLGGSTATTLSFGYGTANNNLDLQEIADTNQSRVIVEDMAYNPGGGIAFWHTPFNSNAERIAWSNGSESELRNRTANLHATLGPTDLFGPLSYMYDPSGNVKTIGTQSFDYDAQARLLHADLGAVSLNYAYDGLGNMTSRTGAGVFARTHTSNRIDDQPAGERFSYDGRGNLLQYGPSGAATDFWDFDPLNMAETFHKSGGSNIVYLYDAEGKRVATVDNQQGTATYSVRGPQGQVLSEFKGGVSDADPDWVRDYVYAGPQRVATISAAPSCISGVTATAQDEKVELCWSPSPDPRVRGYEVFRQVGLGWNAVGCFLDEGLSDVSFVDTGLTNGTQYSYLILPFDEEGRRTSTSAATQTCGVVSATPGCGLQGCKSTSEVGLGLQGMVVTGTGPEASYPDLARGWDITAGVPFRVSDLEIHPYLNNYGVNVATGNVFNYFQTATDPQMQSFEVDPEEIITGAGPGPVHAPHVRSFLYESGGPWAPIPKINYFAYGTLKFGVNVNSGELLLSLADPIDEILTGAGPGAVFGPHVRGWRTSPLPVTPIEKVNFFAYPTLKWGVNVAAGDIDGDGFDEILTGPGPGSTFAAHVRGFNFDGVSMSAIDKVNFWSHSSMYGVRPESAILDDDNFDEILAAPGPEPAISGVPEINAYDYDNTAISCKWDLTLDVGTTYGASAVGGNLDGYRSDGHGIPGASSTDEVVVANGPDTDIPMPPDPPGELFLTAAYSIVSGSPDTANATFWQSYGGRVGYGLGTRVAVLYPVPFDEPMSLGASASSTGLLTSLEGLVRATPDGSVPDPTTDPAQRTNNNVWADPGQKAVILQEIAGVRQGLGTLEFADIVTKLDGITSIVNTHVLNASARTAMLEVLGDLRSFFAQPFVPSTGVTSEISLPSPDALSEGLFTREATFASSGTPGELAAIDAATLRPRLVRSGGAGGPDICRAVSAVAGANTVLADEPFSVQRQVESSQASLALARKGKSVLLHQEGCSTGCPQLEPQDVIVLPNGVGRTGGSALVSVKVSASDGILLRVDGIDDPSTATTALLRRSVRVGNRLARSPIDPGLVYVATNLGVDTINANTSAITTDALSVPAADLALGIHPSGGAVAYVIEAGSNRLHALDLPSGTTRVAPFDVTGCGPTALRVTPDGRLVVVTCSQSDEVAILDEDLALLRRVPVRSSPSEIVLSDDSGTAFVSSPSSDVVSVIYLQNASLPPLVDQLADGIDALPNASFDQNADARRAAFRGQLNGVRAILAQAESMVPGQARDQLLEAARRALNLNVQGRMDGLLGLPAEDDWIIDSAGQAYGLRRIAFLDSSIQAMSEGSGGGEPEGFGGGSPPLLSCGNLPHQPTLPDPSCGNHRCPDDFVQGSTPICPSGCPTTVASPTYTYLLTDHLGSVRRAVTFESGTALESHEFYPFGGRIGGSGSLGQSFRFAGHELDAASDLSYMHARYQGWQLARFLSPDIKATRSPSVNVQLWNRYSYAANNPLSYLDPTGFNATKAVDVKNKVVTFTIHATFYGPKAQSISDRMQAGLDAKFKNVRTAKGFRVVVQLDSKVVPTLPAPEKSAGAITDPNLKADRASQRDTWRVQGSQEHTGMNPVTHVVAGESIKDPSVRGYGDLAPTLSEEQLAHEAGHELGLGDRSAGGPNPCAGDAPCSFMYNPQGSVLPEDVEKMMERVPGE